MTPNKPPLGKVELIAIALGGMIGGGIFSILGVSVEIVGSATPIAIFIGGCLAFFASYSYAKLATYYKDEGATYSFFKKTFPNYQYATSLIAWFIAFGYVSTLALYAYTFSSYFMSMFSSLPFPYQKQFVSFSVIAIFAAINLISVKGMGRIEDFLVYTKVGLLVLISLLFLGSEQKTNFFQEFPGKPSGSLFVVAALTFVAFEGFQLVIHAYNEADNPDRNVPSAIYWSIFGATLIYFVLSIGALSTISTDLLIQDKEYALAAGATRLLGRTGYAIVISGAILATSSAINGTIFGASRLVSVIAQDGVFPRVLAKRKNGHIPTWSIMAMSLFAFVFILSGQLETIIEFGSITFIIVSFLIAIANFHIKEKTKSNAILAILAIVFLGSSALAILYYEWTHDRQQVFYTFSIYSALALCARFLSRPKYVK